MPASIPAGPMRHDEAVIMVAGPPSRGYRAGAGPALVLLHGCGLDDAQLSWAPVWPALTSYAQLLAPDLPGYGGSPLGRTAPTLEGYRRWLLAFLDAAGIQVAVLAGLSLGGAIALRTALDAPARVGGLVLLAPYGVSPRLPGGTIGYLAACAPHAPPPGWPCGTATGCCAPPCAPCSTIPARSPTAWPARPAPCSPTLTPRPLGRPSGTTRRDGPGPAPTSPGT